MSYTDEQIETTLDYLKSRVQGIPTNDQITSMLQNITNQYTALQDLIEALTARMQALEDMQLTHEQDTAAHST